MRRNVHSCTAYGLGCTVVWAIILGAVAVNADPKTRDTYVLVCSGWAIGWLSATIARVVYPPPRTVMAHDQMQAPELRPAPVAEVDDITLVG